MKSALLKKLTAVLMVCVVAFSAVGCGNKKVENNEPVKSNDGSKGEVVNDVDDGSEVFEYTWIGFNTDPVLAKGDDAIFQKIIENKFNIKITPVYVDRAKYKELINLKFASNEIPDVFTCPDHVTLGQWVNQGVLAEFKQKDIQTYAPAIWEDLMDQSKIDPNLTKYTIVDNKNYGLQLISPDSIYRSPVIWRTDWLKKVGIDKIPQTIDEFETALYKFANDDPDGNGKKDTYGCSASGLDAVYGISGYLPEEWGDRDGKVVWGGVQPEMKDVLSRLQKWYKDGAIDPEYVTGENQGGYWAISQPFTNGKIGLSAWACYYHWNAPYYEDQPWTSTNGKLFRELQGENATYDFGSPAVGENGKSMMIATTPATGVTVLGKQMEGQDKKIQRWLKTQNEYCVDKDYFLNIRWGTKGEHWDYDDHGMIKYLLDASTPAEKRPGAMGAEFAFINYQSMKFFKDMNTKQYEFADKVVTDSRVFTACRGSLPSQAKYKAELDKFQKTTYVNIITGVSSIDEFDKFVETWNKQGGEQMTKEANEWRENIDSMSAE